MPFALTGGAAWRGGGTAIRLAYHGCANRPFFHIVIQNSRDDRDSLPIEQVGTYDPMPNTENQKLISLNLERVQHWIGLGAIPTQPVQEIFGIIGLLPVHPRTYLEAWRNRQKAAADAVVAASASVNQTATSSATTGESS